MPNPKGFSVSFGWLASTGNRDYESSRIDEPHLPTDLERGPKGLGTGSRNGQGTRKIGTRAIDGEPQLSCGRDLARTDPARARRPAARARRPAAGTRRPAVCGSCV